MQLINILVPYLVFFSMTLWDTYRYEMCDSTGFEYFVTHNFVIHFYWILFSSSLLSRPTFLLITVMHYYCRFQSPNNDIMYEIIGDDDSPDFFYINPNSGAITLLKSVLETDRNIYRVGIQISSENNLYTREKDALFMLCKSIQFNHYSFIRHSFIHQLIYCCLFAAC